MYLTIILTVSWSLEYREAVFCKEVWTQNGHGTRWTPSSVCSKCRNASSKENRCRMTFYPTFNAAKWEVPQGWKQTSAVTSHFKWAEAAALAKKKKKRGRLALEASRTSSLSEQTHLWPHLVFFVLMGYFFTANLMSYIRSHQASSVRAIRRQAKGIMIKEGNGSTALLPGAMSH